jgi:galactokinase
MVERVGAAGDVSGGAMVRVAPARVNLIGEHTDYTGGYVLPMAIPFYTSARIAASADGSARFRSTSFDGERLVRGADDEVRSGSWSDYPLGVLVEMQRLGVAPEGFDLELSGNVPLGAGLSSSASVEVASCLAMLALAGKSLPAAEIALACQRAENQFVGSPCGIMDQFVITAAKAGHALLLHTRDLSYELVPMNSGGLAGVVIVVVNSMVKHSIAAGGYGDRRKQLEAGQAVLRERFAGLRDLGDATLAQLEQSSDAMTRESYKRCRHVISENARVLRAREAMLRGDAKALGLIELEAHASQRDDFECSCAEIDFLVETAAGLRGCFGARMTGGGFGGCTVNLVEREAAEAFSAELKKAYAVRFEIAAESYVCEAVDGALEQDRSAADRRAKEAQ